ncbi:MAG: NUDIX hydrolase [Azospirillaceae bacterium]|nr:NUDIX hydrolase [Azospirillaceae bacterium]
MNDNCLVNRGPRDRMIPPGDDRERLVCPDCGFIDYQNPRVIVGAVCTWEDRILMCRRAIEPRRGYWTLPAGFMELGETSADGARREAWEEARARIDIDALLGIYDVPAIGQVQLIFRARLLSPDVAAGPESAAVALLHWTEIPWPELAFPTVALALKDFHARQGQAGFAASIDLRPSGDGNR